MTSPLFTQEREVSATPFGVSDFQQAAASGSQQQQASSNVVIRWRTCRLGSSWKQEQGTESCPSVERSLLRGKRDRVFGSVSSSQHEQERILSEKKNLHEYLQKEAERARRSWERRNSDVALNETDQQHESLILELFQANQYLRSPSRPCVSIHAHGPLWLVLRGAWRLAFCVCRGFLVALRRGACPRLTCAPRPWSATS